MGITTDELRILLSVNGASSYVNQMQQVTRATGGFDNAAGKLISTLAKLVSIGAIVRFGKQCIEAASDLQEVANVMNVTFGDSAGLVDRWAKTQAASFGLSETSAKRYIGTYGTMATQFGATREQAASMGIELTKLTGDVASFYNIEDKLAAVKLKSVFTGETESLKELGVVMTEANLNAYAMEKGLGKTVKQMSENEKVGLRYNFVMDKLSHAQGDFARTSDGWANSVRKLRLNVENLKIQVGNELLPVAAQGLAVVNKGLQVLSPVIVNIAKTVRYYGEAWKNASDQTKGLVKTAFAFVAVGAMIPKIALLVGSAIKLLTTNVLTLEGALLGLKAVFGIIGFVLGAIAFKQLTDQMKELKKASETAKSISDIGTSAETSSNAVEDLDQMKELKKASETAKSISDIGTSAETSSNAVDDLSEAMNDLGSATEGLDTFLASFDEVNKVGGNNSLMSNLVNAEDLTNILGVADGIGDIQSKLSSLDVPQIDTPQIDILDPEWWKKKWKKIKGYLKTLLKPSEFWDNWKVGIEMIGEWFEEMFPKWSAFWEEAGAAAADALQPVQNALDTIAEKFEKSAWFKYFAGAGANLADLQDEDNNGPETFSYTSKSGKTREVLKYNTDGTETDLYKKYLATQGNQNRTVNQTNVTNNSSPTTVQVNPTIMIDGRKITGAVIDGINAITRSAGKSPLVE